MSDLTLLVFSISTKPVPMFRGLVSMAKPLFLLQQQCPENHTQALVCSTNQI